MRALLSDRALVLGSRSTGLGGMVEEPRARFHVARWGVFCHTARLRNSPPRLKLVLSDRTFFIPKRNRPTLFALTKLKWKTNTKRHSQTDDLRARFKVPEWRVFCHTERLRNSPPRLKLVLSDSTTGTTQREQRHSLLKWGTFLIRTRCK